MRLSPDIIKRIDALAEHTGRSRGLYIRLALSAFLPQLEEDHWNQKTARYEREGFDRDFEQLTTHLMDEPEPSP
ncbi:RHH-type rel operon transcriptional repressor/antitoxin RelB [Arthrobacter sp. CAN_A214]|uniref:ribbon-helix-helix protein, CopG family n=1 Tax=Arthrobacter sp. CAN_A214 TaxID=2787720 RepID=UPI0018C9EEF1